MKGHIEELLIGGRPMTELEIKQKQEIERLNKIINEIREVASEKAREEIGGWSWYILKIIEEKK